jgi:phage-related protein
MTSSAHLQREADAARVGLADTLGQLRDGVAPSALSGEAIALVKDSGLSILKSLADSARANPVPALLIGAGLTMLLTRTTGGDVMGVATSTLKSAALTGVDAARSAASGVAGAASSAASSVAGAASGVAGAAKDAVKGVTDRTANAVMDTAASVSDRVAGSAMSARQTAVDSMVSVKDRVQSGLDSGKAELDARRQQAGELADELTDQAQTVAQQARQSFARLIEEQPILMAALGAALGAAVGAALPLSQAEKDLIGETGAKAIDIGRGALANTADVVRKEAASADLGAKMGQLADKVVQTVTKDTVKPANA